MNSPMSIARATILGTILSLMPVLSACSSEFVDWQPLRLEEGRVNKLVEAPEIKTDVFVSSFTLLLAFYGEPYRVDSGGKVPISRRLARDKELLWNYTNHASDSEFMAQIEGVPMAPARRKGNTWIVTH